MIDPGTDINSETDSTDIETPILESLPCQLYLITPPRLEDPIAFNAQLPAILESGRVACLQLRIKGASKEDLKYYIDLLRPTVQAHDTAFVLNDDPELAAETGCDGVHIGQSDMPYAQARSVMGSEAIIGITCHGSLDLAMDAGEIGADYVAFGAFFSSQTKEIKHSAPLNILEDWALISTIPCVAIGGITLENCTNLVQARADFLAISGGIWNYRNGPIEAVKDFTEKLTELHTHTLR